MCDGDLFDDDLKMKAVNILAANEPEIQGRESNKKSILEKSQIVWISGIR